MSRLCIIQYKKYNLQKMKFFKIKFDDELLYNILNTDLIYELIRFF